MRRILSLVLLAAAAMGGILPARASGRMAPEELPYKVMFKWGLINKQAGSAVINLSHGADGYYSILSARSEPWADRIYRVRDTLKSHMAYEKFLPITYEKIANEASDHKHDRVIFNYSQSPKVSAECYRKVYTKGELRVDEHKTLHADSNAVDMLSAFYLMRTLPYSTWNAGKEYVVPIFSGKQKETLTIKYHGIVPLKVDGKEYDTYHITFMFTSKGGKKSSDDMDAWIATDSGRIPLRMEGKLPVGKVHCIYTGPLE